MEKSAMGEIPSTYFDSEKSTKFYGYADPRPDNITHPLGSPKVNKHFDDNCSTDSMKIDEKKLENLSDEAIAANDKNSTDTIVQDKIQNQKTRVKAKQSQSKKKPKSQRGLNKPTGFEDFHADPPQTTESYFEDRKLYDPVLPFVSRILTAIQRFERTRKLNNERRDVFYKYLAYGGVDVGPNAFQGGQDVEGMDKDELATTLAQTSIADDKKNHDSQTGLYVVDFEGCMKGFLSRRAVYINGLETIEKVKVVTTTLERFMDYLLQHDVCPEYRIEVLQTRNFCREATSEIWACAEATRWLPGNFNIACSTLFGGVHFLNLTGINAEQPEDTDQNTYVRMTTDVASQVLRCGIAGAASEEVYHSFLFLSNDNGSHFEVVEVREYAGFEITRIESPTKECIELHKTKTKNLKPVGRVYAKPWKNPDSPPEDLTAAEREALANSRSDPSQLSQNQHQLEYVFFIEGDIQAHLRVGTKIEATIRKLNCGIWFFDEVLRVFPTFDTFLVNELMIGWKEPAPKNAALENSGNEEDL